MRIYIDESGNFIPGSQISRVCCIAALIIPESVASTLLSEFEVLRSTWTNEAELKGSSLKDDQMSQVLTLLGRFDVLAHIVAIDLSHQTPEEATQFQYGQAEGFVKGLTPQHNPEGRRWIYALRDEWLQLPLQLMVQLYTLILVVEEVIRTAPNYYAQRLPSELGKFDWVIDPKDLRPTRYEELWQKIVCPVLQTMSLEQPMARIEEFDYSAFARFDMHGIPEYMKPHLPKAPKDREGRAGVNLGMLMRESVSFPDSRDSSGLQLVDILAAAFTKAMNGKLPPPVWRLLGPLMVEAPHLKPTARLVVLGEGPRHLLGEYHTYVLKGIRNRAKRMFVPDR